MKKINLKGISEILSEKELKNVMGGIEAVTLYDYKCPDGSHIYSSTGDSSTNKQICCMSGHGC